MVVFLSICRDHGQCALSVSLNACDKELMKGTLGESAFKITAFKKTVYQTLGCEQIHVLIFLIFLVFRNQE